MNDKLHVLIVEDEEIERNALTMMLQFSSSEIQEIQTAENGIAAVDAYRHFLPNLVLMDINLPGISGLEAIRQMQRIQASAKFVIVSAYNLFSYAQEAIRMGVSDFLIKPIKAENLQPILTDLLTQLHQSEADTQQRLRQQEKLAAIQPLLESDCIYSIASMRSNTSITAIFNFLQIPIQAGCVFIAKGELCSYAFVSELKTRLQNIGLTCLGDIINELCVFVLLSEHAISQEQVQKSLLYIAETIGRSGELVHFGIGSICAPDENLKLSYEQAASAVQYAVLHDLPIALHTDVREEHIDLTCEVRAAAESVCRQIRLGNREEVSGEICRLFASMQLSLGQQNILSQTYWFYALVCSKLPDLDTEALHLTGSRILSYRDIPALRDLIVSSLCSMADMQRNLSPQHGTQAVEDMMRLITERYDQDLTLEDVAEQLNFSLYYLSKLFKKYVGMTFTEYLTQYRIEQSKAMLQRGEKSVKEIAFAVGFNSQGYFAKIFRKYTGLAPSEYREQISPGEQCEIEEEENLAHEHQKQE